MRKRNRTASHRSIPASEFKTTCLALMDEVESLGSEIIITKHRRPVTKLVPARVPFINRSPGVIHVTNDNDLIAPVNPDWDVDADL